VEVRSRNKLYSELGTLTLENKIRVRMETSTEGVKPNYFLFLTPYSLYVRAIKKLRNYSDRRSVNFAFFSLSLIK
jgi:hypothetical protein